MTPIHDVIIIGAGAAGLMCAIEAGKRGRSVLLVDHMEKIAEKIGSRAADAVTSRMSMRRRIIFLSQNPHFCKSALSQYTQQDFIALVQKHGISYHEKKLGQLFCDGSSSQIINMLVQEMEDAGVELQADTRIHNVECASEGFAVRTNKGEHRCASLVIASGGLSIPKIGATPFGYDIAEKFGLKVTATRAGLVPLTFDGPMLEKCKSLSGLSVEADVKCGKKTFNEGLLFTHRGLSGPSILQISSYWRDGEEITVDMAPGTNVTEFLKDKKNSQAKQQASTVLSEILPKRLAQNICDELNCNGTMGDLSHAKCQTIGQAVNDWRIIPTGTEGYRTAEVTLGGVDTKELSSQTMESVKQPGLFFIGEVVDVTGHLGGFNFQWAWSSGYVAGQHA